MFIIAVDLHEKCMQSAWGYTWIIMHYVLLKLNGYIYGSIGFYVSDLSTVGLVWEVMKLSQAVVKL